MMANDTDISSRASVEAFRSPQAVQIAIVDDDVTVLGLIEDVLKGESDIEIETFHDSVRALERLRERSFDVLITDLKMPKVDGLGLIEEIRRLHRDTLVIIITGYATMETCLEALRFGAYDFMTKPFRMDEFLHTVHNCVDRVKMKRETSEMRERLDEARARLEEEQQTTEALRKEIKEIEEQNQIYQQLLQRAGVNPRGAGPPKSGSGAGVYSRLAEKSSDRVSRELERLSQLEESGAISAREAERARAKIQEGQA